MDGMSRGSSGPGSGSDEPECEDAAGEGEGMLAVLGEFRRLYRARMDRLEQNPRSPTYNKEKMELLESWIADLSQQNLTLVQTVKELETEASRRCEMLESRLISTTSSTKQYMLQLHQLEKQIQQLVAGRVQAEQQAADMTSLVDRLTLENKQLRAENEQRQREEHQRQQDAVGQMSTGGATQAQSGAELSPAEQVRDDVDSHLRRLRSDLRVALREKEDLRDLLDIRNCELDESRAEVAGLRERLERAVQEQRSAAAAAARPGKHKAEPGSEVTRLQRHCRDLVEQRNQALAELAKVKVQLMEVMEDEVDSREVAHQGVQVCLEEAPVTSHKDQLNGSSLTMVHKSANGHYPQRFTNHEELYRGVSSSSSGSSTTTDQRIIRLENELDEKCQLLVELQMHLASSRNEVDLKDATLAKLERKLETVRKELTAGQERLAQSDGERAGLRKQNEILEEEVTKLRRVADEATEVRYRLESEADQQIGQITELQERLLASETFNKELNAKCVQKDMEIGQQWTTISSLQEAVLEAKKQIEELQPGQSFFGGLLGGATVGASESAETVARLKMDLATAQSQFKQCFSETVKQSAVIESLQDENGKLGRQVSQLRSKVNTMESLLKASQRDEDGGEDSSGDVALIETMFERLQTEVCVLADALDQSPKKTGHQPARTASLDQGTQTDEQGENSPAGACDECQRREQRLTQQRDTIDYLKQLLQQREEAGAGETGDPTPALSQELDQLRHENAVWRLRVTQGQQQLTELRRSLTALKTGVDECKKEECLLSEARSQLSAARAEIQRRSSVEHQLDQVRSQMDQLILEKEQQQLMIRGLQRDLSDDAAPSGGSFRQQAEAERLASQLRDEQQNSRELASQLTAEQERCQKLNDELDTLRQELTEAASRRRQLEQQLADTLAGQQEVHTQADLIVEHVTGWLEEWRAENQRLSRRIGQQAETIAGLQMENKHLADRLVFLHHSPAPVLTSPSRPHSHPSFHLHHKLPGEPRPAACPHSRRSLFTGNEGYPHSATDCQAGEGYPGSYTEGYPPPRPGRPDSYPHSFTEGFYPSAQHGQQGQRGAAPQTPCTSCSPAAHTTAPPMSTPSHQPVYSPGGGHHPPPPPVTPGTPGSVDHVPTRESQVAWPAHIFDMVSELRMRTHPPISARQTEPDNRR